MPKCQRCGAGGLLTRVQVCGSCGKRVCARCYLNDHGQSLCLDCYPQLIDWHKNNVLTGYNSQCPLCGAREALHVFNPVLYRDSSVAYKDGKQIVRYHGDLRFSAYVGCERCGNPVNEASISTLRKATKAEMAGRYEDAARLYEDLDFLDKARSLRERGRVSTVRHQHVDINHLLEQVRQGNLVVPYKCPNCSAGITINRDTSVDRLTNCPYCGTALVVSDIERFLSSIL